MAGPRRRRERKLPVQQLSILAICRFAEPLASTSLFPYLPEMIESFGVAKDDVGKWAGLTAAAFSICQAITGVPWGRFSDVYGRKPAILLGLCSTMCTSLLLGLSANLPMALVARALAGAGNGNVGILRTTVAEMVPFKELQPRAFSVMPLVWNVGSIFGPSLGGALANPFGVKPSEGRAHTSKNPLVAFPYLLPNLVSAVFFAVGIAVGVLFLEETLETVRDRRDYGRVLGRKLTRMVMRSLKAVNSVSLRSRKAATRLAGGDNESDPLLKSTAATGVVDEESSSSSSNASDTLRKKLKKPAPSFSEVLNRQSLINLLAYTILALHSIAYDQLLPVLLHYNRIGEPKTTPYAPPLRFAGGVGLDHFTIGLLSTGYGVAGMVVQFLCFPPLCRRFGTLFCFRAVSCGFPLVYVLTPFAVLLPTQRAQAAGVFAAMLAKSWCVIFAFPCSTILLTNSANSLRVLGTLNGFATSMSAIGRAVGPAITGSLFTLGVKRGYLIAPLWFLAAVAVLGAVLCIWVEDGKGFDADEDDDDEDGPQEEEQGVEGIEQRLQESGEQQQQLTTAAADGRLPAPVLSLPQDGHEEQTYGTLAPLTRSPTVSSAAVTEDDEPYDGLLGPTSRRTTDASSRPVEHLALASQGSSQRLKRESSVPIGMGSQGISRKYSFNLGQSLGSQGSFHQ